MRHSADLGGVPGMGPVPAKDDAQPFHAMWERRVLALTLAMGATGSWTLDASRHARESIPAELYLSLSYYHIWLEALENLLVQKGLVTKEELASGTVLAPPALLSRTLRAADVASALRRGAPTARSASTPAMFALDNRVRTKAPHHSGHTRLPGYLTGSIGTVETVYGAHVFPDSNAAGSGEDPQWLYRVRFEATNALHDAKSGGFSVSADLWEPYLEKA